jgi:hypothetical protein
VIPMTTNQPARAWRALRRTASALKHINDEQIQMWEAFSRVPAGRGTGHTA